MSQLVGTNQSQRLITCSNLKEDIHLKENTMAWEDDAEDTWKQSNIYKRKTHSNAFAHWMVYRR